jgi:hypothetical protein
MTATKRDIGSSARFGNWSDERFQSLASFRLNIGVIADSVAFSAFMKSLKEERRASRGKSEISRRLL